MKELLAFIVIIAFLLSIVPADTAYAGWKENYREKYSKKQVKAGSAEEKRIKTLANMDFQYKDWRKTSTKWVRKSTDTFQGQSTNFTPANVGKEEKEGKIGRTLTGLVQEMGHFIANPTEPVKGEASSPTK